MIWKKNESMKHVAERERKREREIILYITIGSGERKIVCSKEGRKTARFATILDGDINLDKMLLSYVNSLAFVEWWAFAWAYSRDERARETTRAHAREKSNLRFQRSGVSKPTNHQTLSPRVQRRWPIQKAENSRSTGSTISLNRFVDRKFLLISRNNLHCALIFSMMLCHHL